MLNVVMLSVVAPIRYQHQIWSHFGLKLSRFKIDNSISIGIGQVIQTIFFNIDQTFLKVLIWPLRFSSFLSVFIATKFLVANLQDFLQTS
jgi:hypothetical protein